MNPRIDLHQISRGKQRSAAPRGGAGEQIVLVLAGSIHGREVGRAALAAASVEAQIGMRCAARVVQRRGQQVRERLAGSAAREQRLTHAPSGATQVVQVGEDSGDRVAHLIG